MEAAADDAGGDEIVDAGIAADGAENERSYIDRVVLEGDGDEDDSSFVLGEVDESADEFEYDSDEELPDIDIKDRDFKPESSSSEGKLSEGATALLYWKMDKEESFSDWTIEVTISGEGDAKKYYHVHRNVLAFGPKRSEYFEALFQSGQFREAENNTSEVSLSDDIADHFPAFLDFVYCPPSECGCIITKDNCYALYYLAQYFLVPELTSKIDAFLSRDAYNLSHLEKYLLDFSGPENEVIPFLRPHATRACAEMILSGDRDGETFALPIASLLAIVPPAMFLQIMALVKLSVAARSSLEQFHICNLAVDYVRTHKDIIDANYFHALTCELYLPTEIHNAGPVVVGLLRIANEKGWEMGRTGFIESCTAVLAQYLSIRSVRWANERSVWREITRAIPLGVVSDLIAWSFRAHATLDPEEFEDVSCKIMSEGYGVPVGHIVPVSVKSTDSVGYIRYLVSHHLNILLEPRGFYVYYGGLKLDTDALVCNCDISSGAVLEIKRV